uniref:Hairy-related 5 n=1 Tax=Cynoglossus semilaevis TaxID=244447 RepID=A0A3P8WKL4_CYNSE
MKVLSSPDIPRKRTMRRVPKPLMEKRRRERINHSLETLRLLMLESTRNEKLKNPKVEKAEILESVVEFLKTDNDVMPRDQTCTSQNKNTYHDGMRSCLLRVSHFISTKNQDPEEPGVAPEPDRHHSPPGHTHAALTPRGGDSSPQVPPLMARHRRSTLLHHSTSTPAPTHFAEPVWRPWPQ